MFERPTKTLKHSLFNVLENAQDYIADVCFEYPNIKIWAHKALLIARVPEPFRKQYMAQLDQQPQPKDSKLTLDVSVVIPYTTLRQLLRFWYIAEFTAPLDEASLLSTDISGLSVAETSSLLQSEVETSIRLEIKDLEDKLGLTLLPTTQFVGPAADTDQWTADLKRMMDDRICSDVMINIFNVPHQQQQQQQQTPQNTVTAATAQKQISFPAHRFILASQSPYFYAVFCTEFREASTSSVHMPSDLFSSTTLQVILHYFYTDTLILPPFISDSTKKLQAHLVRLNEKKHKLRILQKVFTAADFLGHYNTICKAILLKMAVICHQFKCVCTECATLLPSMLLFADKNEKYVSKLRTKLIALYADPLDSLAPLWSQKPFATLVNSMTSVRVPIITSTVPATTTSNSNSIINTPSTKSNDGAEVISQIFSSNNNNNSNSNKAAAIITANTSTNPVPLSQHHAPTSATHSPVSTTTTTTTTTTNTTGNTHATTDSTQSLSLSSVSTSSDINLIEEITERTFTNLTKHNSVRALHSLHLCLSYLRGSDPLPTWSQPVLNILNQFLHHTVDMIASNFDYYCVEYPILLSCVDGIGFGFSVDFLGFVLNKVLTEGIHDGNAAILYQGIVRDLGGRQEMVRNVAVDSVLLDARVKCAQYLNKRWGAVKEEGGFDTIDKEIVRLIAEDINVPVRTLIKPVDNDFSTMFSFKPKKTVNTAVSRAVSKDESNSSISTINTNMTSTMSTAAKRLSIGSITSSIHPHQDDMSNHNNKYRLGRSRSLSASNSNQDSILRKNTQLQLQHHSDNEDTVDSAANEIVRNKSSSSNNNSNSSSHPHSSTTNSIHYHHRSYRRQGSTSSLTDALLPMDTAGKENDAKKEEVDSAASVAPRPTRLRFALPDTPSRTKPPGQHRLSAIQGSGNVNNNTLNMAQRASARKRGGSRRAKSPGRSRWSLGYNTSDSSDDESGGKVKQVPLVGQKVELLRRPLPTQGTIKYIGEVEFAKGTWVGVELESRLGNNDGSIEGKRYFETFPQRGAFVKIDDFKIIAPPAEKK